MRSRPTARRPPARRGRIKRSNHRAELPPRQDHGYRWSRSRRPSLRSASNPPSAWRPSKLIGTLARTGARFDPRAKSVLSQGATSARPRPFSTESACQHWPMTPEFALSSSIIRAIRRHEILRPRTECTAAVTRTAEESSIILGALIDPFGDCLHVLWRQVTRIDSRQDDVVVLGKVDLVIFRHVNRGVSLVL